MPAKKPNPVDIIVGRNIRFQRLEKAMSQEALASRLGLTFQQVQKYEKGTNRTSASRLASIASVLQIDVLTLFDGVERVKVTGGRTLSDLVEDPKAIALLQAFALIKNPITRNTIVELVSAIGQHS